MQIKNITSEGICGQSITLNILDLYTLENQVIRALEERDLAIHWMQDFQKFCKETKFPAVKDGEEREFTLDSYIGEDWIFDGQKARDYRNCLRETWVRDHYPFPNDKEQNEDHVKARCSLNDEVIDLIYKFLRKLRLPQTEKATIFD